MVSIAGAEGEKTRFIKIAPSDNFNGDDEVVHYLLWY